MTRYYYTDPLAAAWMARHFGMRYESPVRTSSNPQWDNAMFYVNRNGNWHNVEYYIHPDSLHLLEPKEGDLLECNNTNKLLYGICLAFDKLAESVCVESDSGHWSIGDSRVKIIQRNNIPFMWPEKEESND